MTGRATPARAAEARDMRVVRRYQIGPGGMAYLAATGLIVATGWYTQSNMLYWAAGLMFSGLAVSALWSWLSMQRMQVERLLPSHGIVGEAVVLRYRVEHRGRLPVFGLVVSEHWAGRSGPLHEQPLRLRGRPHGWMLHIGPGQVLQAEAPCYPLRRGDLRFEQVVLSSAFPFGVIRSVVRVDQPGTLLIYPALSRVDRQLVQRCASLDPTGQRHIERAGGQEEFYSLRPYRPGDSLKQVDWKHTAKRGELVSRELTQPSPPRMVVELDLTHAARDLTGLAAVETGVSFTASLICDAYLQGVRIGLCVRGAPAGVFPEHHSLPHRARLLEQLARLDTTLSQTHPAAGSLMPSVVVAPGAADRAQAPPRVGQRQLDAWLATSSGRAAMLAARPTRTRGRWKR